MFARRVSPVEPTYSDCMFFLSSVILGKSHYVLFNLVSAMQPRMLVTFDTDLRPLPVSVRVGQVSGRPMVKDA